MDEPDTEAVTQRLRPLLCRFPQSGAALERRSRDAPRRLATMQDLMDDITRTIAPIEASYPDGLPNSVVTPDSGPAPDRLTTFVETASLRRR
jgi:hypothetical protein